MSTLAADVFDRAPYTESENNLAGVVEQPDDLLFSAEGRIGVWRYNARIAQGLIAWSIGCLVAWMGYSTDSGMIMAITMIPALVLVIVASIAMLYAAIKRLHDLGRSGWYYLITLIPIVGVVWSLYYALKPGSEDDNDFGSAREATKTDKMMGMFGMVLVIGINVLYLIPMGD